MLIKDVHYPLKITKFFKDLYIYSLSLFYIIIDNFYNKVNRLIF